MLVECLPCCDRVSVPWVEVLEGGLQAGWRLRVAQWRREQVVVVGPLPPSHSVSGQRWKTRGSVVSDRAAREPVVPCSSCHVTALPPLRQLASGGAGIDSTGVAQELLGEASFQIIQVGFQKLLSNRSSVR